MGGPTLSIGLTAALIWMALLVIARKDADFDWHKLVIVTAVTAVGTALLPMVFSIFLFENLKLDVTRWWPLMVVGGLLMQVGVFALMLHKYLWVPIHKALLVWLFVQAAGVAKEYVFYRVAGQGFAAFAFHSVTGRDMDSGEEEGTLDPDVAAMLTSAEGGCSVTDDTESAEEPDADGAVAVTAHDKPAAGTLDPNWEEARRLLVVKGKAEKGGRTIFFVNNDVVEVGKVVLVVSKDKSYVFRMTAVRNGSPVWEPVQP